MSMRFAHTMVRISNIEQSLHFYCDLLGLKEIRRIDNEAGQFTLIFLAAPKDTQCAVETRSCELELTYNWQAEKYPWPERSFGHLAYRVENIYDICEKLQTGGVTILRPPRDGHMAFVRSPDGISIELIQDGEKLAPSEPWASMENTGSW